MRALNRVFKRGEQQGTERGQTISTAVIPDVGHTAKDHKPIDGLYQKNRPLFNSKMTINGEIFEFVSEIMNSATRTLETREVTDIHRGSSIQAE